jgi:hypothetical protein
MLLRCPQFLAAAGFNFETVAGNAFGRAAIPGANGRPQVFKPSRADP